MRVSLVVPCYNEQECLPRTAAELAVILGECQEAGLAGSESEIVFVDDGSQDETWKCITEAALAHPAVRGLRLSRNCGHQNALLAGLEAAAGDFVISIDADLQDDPVVIKDMLRGAREGADVVLGVRRGRRADSLFKRLTAENYYRLLRLAGVRLVFNHADFRGLSRRALEALLRYGETNLFLRGLIGQLGFPTLLVHYDRRERLAGETKYPLHKMLSFAWQGVTSFSIVPLRIIVAIGSMFFLLSVVFVVWALYVRFVYDLAVPGWASTTIPIVFFSGVQLLAMGVIGEYLGKIYLETKRRPRYFVAETVGSEKGGNGPAEV
jgi:glycosyltransferase involved in cell wall biosynthesis